ncbi:hypothetical protein [Sporosarcina sp. NCCP-2222]|uniref:hypothetical protein n=1 Tax=Sporosarcina sp. NCCP-2222 TaxID=2935073 RepID=UPI0020BFB224|nr:hypothetical protein [Sporosarcina sp. NCCP-2222]
MNKVWANQDIQSLLTNWFHGKKTESIQQLEHAITSEKELLMEELRVALQDEMKKAEEELARYTEEETAKRVKELQDYAAGLMANIQIDTTAKKAEISSDLDATLAQAMEQLSGSAGVCTPTTTPSTPIPTVPKPGEGQEGNPGDMEEATEPETEPTETDPSDDAKQEEEQPEDGSTNGTDEKQEVVETEAPSLRPEEEAETLPSMEETDSIIEINVR